MIVSCLGWISSDPSPNLLAQDVIPGPASLASNAGKSSCSQVGVSENSDFARFTSPAPETLSGLSDRSFASAFFGGDGGPSVFGVAPPLSGKDPAEWPDISEPGPDMGDFPNSAFTLPKGRAYIEMAPATFLNASTQNPPAYLTPFLFRYGLTDNVEFRIFGHGLTSDNGSNPTTGISPLNFDLKVHLWNDRKEWLIPAVSLEIYMLTQTGSPQFNSGTEPSINLNFDLPITEKLNFEWTLGRSGVQETINSGGIIAGTNLNFHPNFQQFSASWALEYELSDRLEVFVHGFHNGAVVLNIGAGDAIGTGLFWTFSPRVKGFGSINTGLSRNLPTVAYQMGFALAL